MEVTILILLLVGICLVLSFLFSGMEAGVLALNRLRIRQLMRAGDSRARVLHDYLEKPERFLWTILIGNTLANFITVGVTVVFLRQAWGQWPGLMWLVFLAALFLFYTFFELLPKMLFRMFPTRMCLALAGPFRFIHVGLSPLVSLMTSQSRWLQRWTGGKIFAGHLFGSREEMRLVMQESAQGLTSEERLMINRVLDLQTITVRNVMIPIETAATVNMRTTMGEVLKLSRENRFSRFPVWRMEGPRRRIAGLVNLRTVLFQEELNPARTAADYLKPALYLDEELRLEAALKQMQRGGQRLAIVLGRDRREVGIVTLQDVLKVIFGEVRL